MRILIADDNDLVRRGIRNFLSLQEDMEVCGEAVDGEGALRQAREVRPEVILLDIRMPGRSGLEIARQLRVEMPRTKILVMSQHDPEGLLPQAIEAGADGCVDKGSLSTDLLKAIRGKADQRRSARASEKPSVEQARRGPEA